MCVKILLSLAMYMFGAEAPGAALVTVAIVHTILLFITLGLISHLFFFHVYLSKGCMLLYSGTCLYRAL